MSSAKKAVLVLMLAATLGIWGCQESQVSSRVAAHVRQLEGRNAKLEEDYKTTVNECAQLRKKLTAVAERCLQLQKQQQELEEITKQRDELQQRVTVVEGERANLQGQLVRFSRELQALVGRVEQVTSNRGGSAVGSTVSMQK